MRLTMRICLFALSTSACGSGSVAATYRFDTLEIPGGRVVRATDINNQGHILGTLVLGPHFLRNGRQAVSQKVQSCS